MNDSIYSRSSRFFWALKQGIHHLETFWAIILGYKDSCVIWPPEGIPLKVYGFTGKAFYKPPHDFPIHCETEHDRRCWYKFHLDNGLIVIALDTRWKA